MELLETWLKKYALALVLALSLGIALLMDLGGVVGPDAMPYGDGEGYARRALTLCGFLHSGQWSAFCQTYTLPRYSTLAPPQYWIFFLLPAGWASFTAYGIITSLVNTCCLALGLWAICSVLERVAWTVPLFLLCATQNLTLDASLFYFMDPTFLAFFTLSLAAQMAAWKKNDFSASFLSGAGLSLLFWIKPANALLYAFFFFLAELFFIALLRWKKKEVPSSVAAGEQHLTRHALGLLAGCGPLFLCAFATGGFQLIMRLIDANETSDLFVTHLTCTGLTRLLYFPLCFAYFYHAFLLLLIAGVLAACWFADKSKKSAQPIDPTFPWFLLVPLALSYLIFCEYYSLGMIYKTMRSVLPVLPLGWLLIFWWAEKSRVRLGLLTLGTAAYVACAYLQVFGNVFQTTLVQSESFQLENDWLSQLPAARDATQDGTDYTREILAQVSQTCPPGTKIAVNSERLFLTAESLSWFADHDHLLRGETTLPYAFHNFISPQGEFNHDSLIGAQVLLVYTAASLQYSASVQQESDQLLQYLQAHPATARLLSLHLLGQQVGALVLLAHPVTEPEGQAFLHAAGAPGYEPEVARFSAQHDRYLDWNDCVDILHRCYLRHFGPASPQP